MSNPYTFKDLLERHKACHTPNVSRCIGKHKVNTYGRIVVKIRGNILFFTSTNIIFRFTSSQSSGKTLLVRIFSTQIFQYPGLVVKGLIKVRKYVESNWTRCLFFTNIEKYLAFQGICKNMSALQCIPVYVEIRKYSSPVAGSAFISDHQVQKEAPFIKTLCLTCSMHYSTTGKVCFLRMNTVWNWKQISTQTLAIIDITTMSPATFSCCKKTAMPLAERIATASDGCCNSGT